MSADAATLIGTCLVSWMALACGGDPGGGGGGRPDGPGPRLVALDSVRLIEGEDAIIESPAKLVVDPIDGSFLVPDFGGGRALRFDRNGALVRQYGRPGEGPGELERAMAALIFDSTTVAVYDHANRRLSMFDRSTGEFRTSYELPAGGSLGSTSPIVAPPWIWFPTVPPDWTTGRADVESVLRWWPGQEAEHLGLMPREFSSAVSEARWTYPNFLTEGSLAIRDGLLYRGWQAMNDLWVLTLEGNIRDTLRPPAVRRRGVAEDIPERFGELDADGRRGAISWLRQLHFLPDGMLAITHHDRGSPDVRATTVWVGVLDVDGRRACMDALLPTSPDTYSLETFRADTLFQLDRRIVGQNMETWVRMFRVETDACDWIDLD